jgi:hypothetical protein
MSHPLTSLDAVENIRPSAIGARAEAAVASALVRAGKTVFLPAFGAHSRIDLVYQEDRGLLRVQCKTARFATDTLSFRTCSNTANRERDYVGEIDVFGVYSEELRNVYLVPVTDTPGRRCFLRLGPPRNGQRRGVRWAKDYLLGPP